MPLLIVKAAEVVIASAKVIVPPTIAMVTLPVNELPALVKVKEPLPSKVTALVDATVMPVFHAKDP